MQDAAKEIEEVVVRGVVEKPTSLERQAPVLHDRFTEDVEFTHVHINTGGGVKDLIAIYQVAKLIVNYRTAEFLDDKRANAVTLRITVYIRLLGILPLTTSLKFLTLFALEDHKTDGGRMVKKIKVQRDYIQRSINIPIFGRIIYDSDMPRTVIGTLQATTFDILKQGLSVLHGTYSGERSLKAV